MNNDSVRMSRVIARQMQKLLDIMSEDGVLKNGKVVYTAITRQEFWKNVARQLNGIPGGVYKTPYKWSKMWADWKHKTKGKAKKLCKNSYNLDEPKSLLTQLEIKLLNLIGLSLNCLDEDQEEAENQIETKHEMESVDFMESDIEINPAECVAEDSKVDYEDESDDLATLKKVFDRIKPKEKIYKKRKIDTSPNTSSSIDPGEQHRLRQKDEELRLRAIELRLRGQELKLKEAEMNKVNTLVNIEEEKLRCFKDIAGFLKELVDRTKNGTPGRYNSII